MVFNSKLARGSENRSTTEEKPYDEPVNVEMPRKHPKNYRMAEEKPYIEAANVVLSR